MKKKTIWSENLQSFPYKKTNIPQKTDILIIGGGITGLSCAYFLRNSAFDITLLERLRIGNEYSTTAKTTGKISYIQSNIYSKIESIYGNKTSDLYFQSQKDAYQLINEIIKKHQIDCNYEEIPSYLWATNKNEEIILKNEYNFFKKHHISANFTNNLLNTFHVTKGLLIEKSAVFHPIKYLLALKNICKKNINFLENTTAFEIIPQNKQYLVKTSQGNIICKYIIVATHYPFFTLPGLLPLKLSIENEYVIASKAKNEKLTALSLTNPIHSIRYHTDNESYIIYGGNNHKLGTHLNEEKNYKTHITNFNTFFSKTIDFIWNNHDMISDDYLPFIGPINKKNPHLYIATGYGKWGMTNGTLAGKIIAENILKIKNEYHSIFNPSRKINTIKTKNIILNTFHTMIIFTNTKLIKNKSFFPQNVKLKKINGISYGIYIDNENKIHKVINKCPHLHCSLLFNNFDKTWDCPCHGSRFDLDGNCIKGPSTYSIKLKKDK